MLTAVWLFFEGISFFWWFGLVIIVGSLPLGRLDSDRVDFPALPAVLLVAFLTCWAFFTDSFWVGVKIHWLSYLENVAYYLIAGIVWSMFKWYKLLIKIREMVIRKVDQYNSKEFDPTSGILGYYLDNSDVKPNGSVCPHVTHKENRYRVTGWILYWPFSVVNYIFGKLLQDLVDAILRIFRGVYSRIAQAVFKDIKVTVKGR